MKYKVGEEVVLIGGNVYEITAVSETSDSTGEYWNITYRGIRKGHLDTGEIQFDYGDIDHEKTAELHKKLMLGGLTAKEASDNATKKISVVNEMIKNTIQPSHYQKNGMDLIDVWKDLYNEQEFRAVMKSNVFRYVTRYEEKNGTQDLFKAIEFIERLIEWEENNV